MLKKPADGNPVKFKGKWRVPPAPGQTGALQQPKPGAGLPRKQFCRKGPAVLAGSKLSVGQQCALVVKDVNCIPSPVGKTVGSRPREGVCCSLLFVRPFLE